MTDDPNNPTNPGGARRDSGMRRGGAPKKSLDERIQELREKGVSQANIVREVVGRDPGAQLVSYRNPSERARHMQGTPTRGEIASDLTRLANADIANGSQLDQVLAELQVIRTRLYKAGIVTEEEHRREVMLQVNFGALINMLNANRGMPMRDKLESILTWNEDAEMGSLKILPAYIPGLEEWLKSPDSGLTLRERVEFGRRLDLREEHILSEVELRQYAKEESDGLKEELARAGHPAFPHVEPDPDPVH